MNEKINDGGPAFPMQDWDECIHSRRSETGMTLRDWFAGMALQGTVANPVSGGEKWTTLAEAAYTAADAMLSARKETNEDH